MGRLCSEDGIGANILILITVITKTDSRHEKTYKGGVASYGQIRNRLLNTLTSVAKSINSYLTTMFDFYGLPIDVPEVSDAEKANASNEKVEIIKKEILKTEGYDENFFLPYIELHEFEEMIFLM